MKIEKLPSGSYRVQKQINGKRHSISFDHKPTKREIDEEIQKIRNMSITTLNAANRTFNECAEEFLRINENTLRINTKKGYRSYLRNIDENFKRTRIKEIDNVVLQKLVNDMTASSSPKTVANKYRFITSVLSTFLPDVRYRVNLPQLVQYDYYIPTTEEVKAILNITSDKYYPVMLLGCYGLRWSEVMGLTVEDIIDNELTINKVKVFDDIKKEWIIDPYTKNMTSKRKVPIDPRLANIFIERGYVYEGNHTSLIAYLHRKQHELNIPEFRFHDLRHYFATEIDRAGGFSGKDIQRLGGWKSDHVLSKVYKHNRVDRNQQLRDRVATVIMDAFE